MKSILKIFIETFKVFVQVGVATSLEGRSTFRGVIKLAGVPFAILFVYLLLENLIGGFPLGFYQLFGILIVIHLIYILFLYEKGGWEMSKNATIALFMWIPLVVLILIFLFFVLLILSGAGMH